MTNTNHRPDPRNPHPLSHMPDRLARVDWRAARTESGCRLADLEALVWEEVQAQALRGAARGLAPAQAGRGGRGRSFATSGSQAQRRRAA